MTDLTNQTLKNRYRIDAYLGRGGMAEVYHRAFDTRRTYLVAIKIIHADLAEDYEFARRFCQEADSLSTLAHDNIVRFYSLEKEGLLLFLVMDYVEGITLRTLFAQTNEATSDPDNRKSGLPFSFVPKPEFGNEGGNGYTP